MEKHTILLLVGIVVFALLFFLYYSKFVVKYEGFVSAPSHKVARLPKSGGLSTVPNTMPGATSQNSSEELASFKDISALLDVMNTYNQLYEKFLLNVSKNSDYLNLHTKSISYSIKLQAQIDTGKIVDTLKFVAVERKKYTEAIKHLRQNEPLYRAENKQKAASVTKNLIQQKGPVSLNDIKHAILRTKREKKRIDDLRSEAPDFKQRSLILERVQLDLQQIHDKILRKDMKISQIPIEKTELLRYLIDVEDPTSKISPVPRMTPAQMNKQITYYKNKVSKLSKVSKSSKNTSLKGKKVREHFLSEEISKSVKAKPEGVNVTENFSNYKNNFINDTEDRDENDSREGFKMTDKKKIDIVIPEEYRKAINKLRSSMRDMTWDMHIGVGYDPNVTFQRRITERLNSISNEIEAGRLTKLELKTKFMELDILKQQLETFNRRGMSRSRNPPDEYRKNDVHGSANTSDNSYLLEREIEEDIERRESSEGSEYNKIERDGSLQYQPEQQKLTSINKPLASNDYKIRPGYEMTSEEIKKRGSRGSFDLSKVGTLDYKSRVKFLCSQIKAAGLGEPKEFGCIANQETDVGPTYSWKGNYTMVCARLGNTWGEWYPEMFGCPKPDVSETQRPKISRTCTSPPPPPPLEPPKMPCTND